MQFKKLCIFCATLRAGFLGQAGRGREVVEGQKLDVLKLPKQLNHTA